MNRFNLTFRGEIVEGHDPDRAKSRLAEMLATDDSAFLERCFSGDPVVLRRNLERKEAAELYARLRRMGIHVDLVKISERGNLGGGDTLQTAKAEAKNSSADTPVSEPAPAETPEIKDTTKSKAKKKPKAKARAVTKAESTPRAEGDSGLAAKEEALQTALRAKAKEEAKRKRLIREARKKAVAREAKHKAKLETAKHRAQQLELKLEAETRGAEQKAKEQRDKAEAAAKRKAEREREEAEEAQQQAAARAEQEQQQERERQRQAAERDQRARKEAARKEEQRRRAAEKVEKRERQKHEAEEAAARQQVENARRKREQAAAAAKRRADEARKKAEEEAKRKAEEEEDQTQRRAMEEQAIQRAATELAHKPGLKASENRVKTRMDTPSRQRRSGEDSATGKRRRQPGAPNFFSLRPFRNTPEIRARAAQSNRSMRVAFAAAIFALATTLVVLARLLSLPAPLQLKGPIAIAVAPQGRPVLLAAGRLLLHDRAGVGISDLSLEDLGLASMQPPLAFDLSGKLLAPGRLTTAAEAAQQGQAQALLRCDLEQANCELLSQQLLQTTISALAVNPIDGSLLIADVSAGELLKVSVDGAVLARASIELPAQPVLRLDSGLLFINSAQGPGISVYRYEDGAFGKQLDEVLLLPTTAAAGDVSAVRDFVRNGEFWWALLEGAGSSKASLYRFDSEWQFIDSPALAAETTPEQLIVWRDSTLVRDPRKVPVQRFSSEGASEAALVSSALTDLQAEHGRAAIITQLAWRIGAALCLLAAVAGFCLGNLYRIRRLVYTSCRESGAAPVDALADTIEWVERAGNRSASFGRTGVAFLALATGLVLGAIGLGASAIQLASLLLALTGPAIALLLLQRSDAGHIGLSDDQLFLVDHTGMYHFGGGGRIQYRGPFLLIDDVTVFTGATLLPAFAPTAIAKRVLPLAHDGIKVDRKIVSVKLLQARHPLALGAVIILAAWAAALALLSLHGIF